jgi:toxin YoeB
MDVFYAAKAREDRAYWERKNKAIIARIDGLIADIQTHPFTGLGKPEPLRYQWAGFWSRRINGEHRLVYRVEAGVIFIAQCRFHYTKK